MFRTIDDRIQETNRHHVRLTQQLLGVLGEEQYFARLEVERGSKSAERRRAKLLTEERGRARMLHFMKCPKCGMQIAEIAFGDVRIDQCFSCDGLWLDKGELDLIRQKEGGFLGRMSSVFD